MTCHVGDIEEMHDSWWSWGNYDNDVDQHVDDDDDDDSNDEDDDDVDKKILTITKRLIMLMMMTMVIIFVLPFHDSIINHSF